MEAVRYWYTQQIRYQVIRPFRLALAGVVAEEEIETLVENVAGVGLRLSAHGGAEVIVRAAAPERKGQRGLRASLNAAHNRARAT